MPLSSSEFISTLINTGSDALSNLYEVTFIYNGNKVSESGTMTDSHSVSSTQKMSYRTVQFQPPQRSINTTSVPYLNINVDLPTPSLNLNKQVTFGIRVDENYEIVSFLREASIQDSTGNFNHNYKEPSKVFTIIVDLLKPSTDGEMIAVYRYRYIGCILLNISSLSYNYQGSSNLTLNATFLFKDYDEFKVS